MAYGTQTAGSVIRPAAYCGVVGYKPSYGTIERHGMKLMAFSLDTIGVMARSVADCALLASAVSGRDLGDPERSVDPPWRIGLCRSPAWDSADASTQALLHGAAERLRGGGAVVSDCELPPAYAAAAESHVLLMQAESARAMGWELTNAADKLSDGLREKLQWGRSQSPGSLDAAPRDFRGGPAWLCCRHASVRCAADAVRSGEAPRGLDWTGEPSFNALWTALHVPCVTVPAGTGPVGLPLGLQIVGRVGEDRRRWQ